MQSGPLVKMVAPGWAASYTNLFLGPPRHLESWTSRADKPPFPRLCYSCNLCVGKFDVALLRVHAELSDTVGDVPVAVLVSAIERFEHSLALWAGQVWHSLVVRPSVQRSRTSKSLDLSSSSSSPSQSERPLLVQGEQNRRGAFASHAGTLFSDASIHGRFICAPFYSQLKTSSHMQKLGVVEERTLKAKPGV